jgi:hypothetical protein
MKLLAQKSLKTELRLKSYKILKFYGQKCKFTELKKWFSFKPRVHSQYKTSSGGFVQNYRIIRDFDLFLHGKNGGPSPRAMDRARVGGPRWTHDRDRAARSPERGLSALRSLGARRELRKTERSSGGCSLRASVAETTVKRGRRRWRVNDGSEARWGSTRGTESGKWGRCNTHFLQK